MLSTNKILCSLKQLEYYRNQSIDRCIQSFYYIMYNGVNLKKIIIKIIIKNAKRMPKTPIECAHTA